MRILPVIAYFILIGALSLLPSKEASKLILFNHMDLLAHMGMYFGMAFLLRFSLSGRVPLLGQRFMPLGSFLGAALFAASFGASMEALQGLIPSLGRDFSWLDMLANVIGGVLGARLYPVIISLKLAKAKTSA